MDTVMISLLARHALTAIGGYMVAQGYLDAATSELLIGSTAAGGGLIWSILQKKGLVK